MVYMCILLVVPYGSILRILLVVPLASCCVCLSSYYRVCTQHGLLFNDQFIRIHMIPVMRCNHDRHVLKSQQV